jgi:hypothetical protein
MKNLSWGQHWSFLIFDVSTTHRLSNNRPTKRGKEKSQSDGTLSMRKRNGRPFTGVSIIFDTEPHSDQPC